MIHRIKLDPINIAGCNKVDMENGNIQRGTIRFDTEGHANDVVLEFPNLMAVETAIERLGELRQQWNEALAV